MMDLALQFVPAIIYGVLLAIIILKINDSEGSDESFYFASRGIGTRASIISLVSAETSVATILIFPALGYRSDLAVLWLCTGYILGRIFVASVIYTHLHGFNGLSLYSHIADRGAADFLAVLYLLAKFISGGVRFYMAGYALNSLVGGGIVLWIAIVAIIAGLYSLSGGLKSVVLVDQIQGTILFLSGVWFVGHFLPSDLSSTGAVQLYEPIQWMGKGSAFLLLGGFVITIGSHGADQDMLQRVFAIRDRRKAMKSLMSSGFAGSTVILLFATTGMLLRRSGLELNPASPLIDFVSRYGDPLAKGIFLVLVLGTSMSTLDSTMHAKGAVIKSIVISLRGRAGAPRWYSFYALAGLVLSALAFIEIASWSYRGDFLGLAMGAMNFVYGALIGVVLLFVTSKGERCGRFAIALAIIGGAGTTIAAELAGYYWPLITVLSSGMALIAGVLGRELDRRRSFKASARRA